MSGRFPTRAGFVVCLLVSALLAACGGEATSAVDKSGAADKGVVEKTTSQSVSTPRSSSGASASKAASGKKLPGSVCQLLTVSQVEAVLKTGQTLTTVESEPDPTSDRSCSYVLAGVAPALALSLQGEVEPLDWPAIKALPGAKNVSVRGGEAVFWPTTSVLYAQKNGLAVVIQVVVPPAGETPESATTKLAQPVIDKLP